MMSTVSLLMQRDLKCKSLVKDGWVVLSRKSGKKEVPVRSGRTMQILEKMDNSKKTHSRVTPSGMVKDIMRRIPINKRGREDGLYVTLEGKVLEPNDDVKGCGVRDGSTLHVNHKVRGGGDHESKKPNKQSNMTEKQQKREIQTLVTCQVKTKEESLEDMCSRASEDLVQQVSNTELNSLVGWRLWSVCHKALMARLIRKSNDFWLRSGRFAVYRPCWLNYWRNSWGCVFTAHRTEVKNRAKQTEQELVWDDMTHCHDNWIRRPRRTEIKWRSSRWGRRKKRRQSGWNASRSGMSEAKDWSESSTVWRETLRQVAHVLGAQSCKRNGSSPSGAVKSADRQRAMTNSASRLTRKTFDPEEGREKH